MPKEFLYSQRVPGPRLTNGTGQDKGDTVCSDAGVPAGTLYPRLRHFPASEGGLSSVGGSSPDGRLPGGATSQGAEEGMGQSLGFEGGTQEFQPEPPYPWWIKMGCYIQDLTQVGGLPTMRIYTWVHSVWRGSGGYEWDYAIDWLVTEYNAQWRYSDGGGDWSFLGSEYDRCDWCAFVDLYSPSWSKRKPWTLRCCQFGRGWNSDFGVWFEDRNPRSGHYERTAYFIEQMVLP